MDVMTQARLICVDMKQKRDPAALLSGMVVGLHLLEEGHVTEAALIMGTIDKLTDELMEEDE